MKWGGGSFVIGGLLLAVAGWSGCATTKPVDYTPTQARLFLESDDATSPTITLPRSGAVISVNSKAVIAEGDILNAVRYIDSRETPQAWPWIPRYWRASDVPELQAPSSALAKTNNAKSTKPRQRTAANKSKA